MLSDYDSKPPNEKKIYRLKFLNEKININFYKLGKSLTYYSITSTSLGKIHITCSDISFRRKWIKYKWTAKNCI